MAKAKNKKKKLAEHISNKKKLQKTKSLNPFEIHINKQKMKVLGQKLKHDRGLPGVSRAKAINKRKGTLLQEFKLMNKSNKFLDKRIGEKNSGFTEDDRAMARYAAVRIKAHKKASIFNLANDEVLTHKGQTLNEIEKFDDPKSDDDDDSLNEGNTGKLESDFVGDAHFGGGVLTNTGSEGFKSHKDLINQLIAESKKRKAEKQKNKEQTLELTEKLDEEWKDLIPLVNRSVKTAEDRVQEVSEVDDYDKVMRELRFEARGQPTDRLKSEDEIAKEEKEKLEKLERERLSRMKGVFNDSIKTVPHRSADDLDDDFAYDSEPEVTLAYNEKGESNIVSDKSRQVDVEEVQDFNNVEEDNDESEDCDTASEDDLSDLKHESSSDDEGNDTNVVEVEGDEMEEEGNDEELNGISKNDIKTDLLQRKKVMEKARQELPYTFELPESYSDLQEVLKNRSPEYHSVILERMIKCNHPSLAESNKEKLGLLFVYLLQYIDDLNFDDDINSCFKTFACLLPHIFDLAQMNQANAQKSILEVVKEKQKDYRKNKRRYPGPSVLLFFKLISCVFPTSDFRHPVVTPSIVFIDQMLFKCKLNTRKDIAYGFFLVNLILEYTSLSKRYLPSAINFLAGLLHMAIPKNTVQRIRVLPPFKSTSNSLALYRKESTLKMSLKLEPTDLIETEITDDFKVRVLYNALKIISEFNYNFKEFASNREIFALIVKYLELIPIDHYNDNMQEEMKNLLSSLKATTEKKLFYLMAEVKRPKALRLYEPNIQKVYDFKKHKVLSKEKAERAKLLHKIKMEKKGALREIRRDNSFLGRVKIKERIQSDKQRQEKVKRIFAEANVQQSELNAMDRKNKRK
ncbi:hypothetical protein RN001_011631 [Aquatica leii]|uniref:Nucleolar protein 14 homolog n=1 Tax=Aquatica leii TaxID=1421715 RepID=A0AAN7PS07_9COLE|nr:hypothetical protein RN001_011631 [Aquatica leii]